MKESDNGTSDCVINTVNTVNIETRDAQTTYSEKRGRNDSVAGKTGGSANTSCGNKNQFSEEAVLACLKVLESEETDDLFEILPRIGVVRDHRFHQPLLELLEHKDVRRREFAACAMGAIADEVFLEPLKEAFIKAQRLRDFGSRGLQTAIIESIGAIGEDKAVDFFLPELLKKHSVAAGGGRRKNDEGMRRWIIGAIGAIAQQGQPRSLAVLADLAINEDPNIQVLALTELSGVYWQRPNDISDELLQNIYGLTASGNSAVAEAALAALQNLADVGCARAEALFRKR